MDISLEQSQCMHVWIWGKNGAAFSSSDSIHALCAHRTTRPTPGWTPGNINILFEEDRVVICDQKLHAYHYIMLPSTLTSIIAVSCVFLFCLAKVQQPCHRPKSQRHHCGMLDTFSGHRFDPHARLEQTCRRGHQQLLSSRYDGVLVREGGHNGLHGLLQLFWLRLDSATCHAGHLCTDLHGCPSPAQTDGAETSTLARLCPQGGILIAVHAAKGSPRGQIAGYHRGPLCYLLAPFAYY